MKKHLKKIIVFIINATIVLIGVFLIKNHEKNKLSVQTSDFSDPQTQNPEIEVNLSDINKSSPNAIVNDAVNQADSSVSNVIDNTNLPSQPAVPKPAPAKVVSPAPLITSSPPAKKVSTPKTKTS
jgi:hypothetical protein